MIQEDVVICIPTKRPPPVKTLENYNPGGYRTGGFSTLIIADPRVYAEHLDHYSSRVAQFLKGEPEIQVVPGVIGMGPQTRECYLQAEKSGCPFFFRMDDDLTPKTFIHKDGHYPELKEVIETAYACLKDTGTTLTGFANSSNRYWMSYEMKRTYGLVHGGARLAVSYGADRFIDVSVVRAEDVYRTCAHRVHDLENGNDGSVGRVAFIGFDKKGSTITAGETSIVATKEQLDAEREMITTRFAGLVTCDGTRFINGGKNEIANWRFRRTPRDWRR